MKPYQRTEKELVSTSEATLILGIGTADVTKSFRERKLRAFRKIKDQLVEATTEEKVGKLFYDRGALQKYLWERKQITQLLKLPFLERMKEKVGAEIDEFFGDEPGCLVCHIPGGFLYGLVIFFYLVEERGKDITFLCVGEEAGSWNEKLIDKRKILLVDDVTKTGGALDKIRKMLKLRAKEAGIKVGEIGSFVYDDFGKFANYSIRTSYEEHLEKIDIQIEKVKGKGYYPS